MSPLPVALLPDEALPVGAANVQVAILPLVVACPETLPDILLNTTVAIFPEAEAPMPPVAVPAGLESVAVVRLDDTVAQPLEAPVGALVLI